MLYLDATISITTLIFSIKHEFYVHLEDAIGFLVDGCRNREKASAIHELGRSNSCHPILEMLPTAIWQFCPHLAHLRQKAVMRQRPKDNFLQRGQ